MFIFAVTMTEHYFIFFSDFHSKDIHLEHHLHCKPNTLASDWQMYYAIDLFIFFGIIVYFQCKIKHFYATVIECHILYIYITHNVSESNVECENPSERHERG